MFPSLRGRVDLKFEDPAKANLAGCDVVFFATPNGIAMQQAPALLDAGVRVIDLAADFRIKDIAEWEKWYGMTHACPDWVDKAVYGLPEMNREQIRSARLIANPGCYPTAVQLGFMPLLKSGLVETASLIADAKSGVSGAGRKAETHIMFAEASDNFKAYGVSGHRHLPEIRQGLSMMSGASVGLTFVPHLTPIIRGIHATLYATDQIRERISRPFSRVPLPKNPLSMFFLKNRTRRRDRFVRPIFAGLQCIDHRGAIPW